MVYRRPSEGFLNRLPEVSKTTGTSKNIANTASSFLPEKSQQPPNMRGGGLTPTPFRISSSFAPPTQFERVKPAGQQLRNHTYESRPILRREGGGRAQTVDLTIDSQPLGMP